MLAVGFTLIFGVARVLNLSHGAFYALGAYFTYTLQRVAQDSAMPAALLAVTTVAVFGVANGAGAWCGRCGIRGWRC